MQTEKPLRYFWVPTTQRNNHSYLSRLETLNDARSSSTKWVLLNRIRESMSPVSSAHTIDSHTRVQRQPPVGWSECSRRMGVTRRSSVFGVGVLWPLSWRRARACDACVDCNRGSQGASARRKGCICLHHGLMLATFQVISICICRQTP